MSETANLGLRYLEPAQAQKHVTVNEALARIDALSPLVLVSCTSAEPPDAEEGAVHAVPVGAGGAWAGQAGRLALRLGGGWVFVVPKPGWRAYSLEDGAGLVFDGLSWREATGGVAASGAATALRIAEVDHTLAAGATSSTAAIIPAGAVVFGVTGRVISEITGTALSFSLGIAGESTNRYGSGLGLQAGSWLRGLTSSPLAYFADTSLTLTGDGGGFDGGAVRLAVHYAELGLPD